MVPVKNPSISVDCVVFGFDGTSLKVLLVKRGYRERQPDGQTVLREDVKLPGSPIYQDEDVSSSAYRILEEMTNLKQVYLKQLQVFSDPDRIGDDDLGWLNETYGFETRRIISIAYYSRVKLSPKIISHTAMRRAEWHDVQSVKRLALDHKAILMTALKTLSTQLANEPIAFELLPRKFTIRQLQNLYEAILGIEIDNRNFRKKILGSGYLEPLQEREKGVAHKPAQYYQFNRHAYERETRLKSKLNFINWHD
ncbi:MAG: NUDIX hydrolase [Rikenellaceae bacterium]|jgi:8-oxo-dGTP diphosphatase|nr:NUDIX hydrolase [Rikenellaceae bacterium]MDR0955303.1 NUDIX hydrolase [Rikenellaceae bacterium]